MAYTLTELTRADDMARTYELYKACMYLPTREKFLRRIESFVLDESIRVYACTAENEIRGVIVAALERTGTAEILGIAVEESMRGKGIGSFMITQLTARYALAEWYAETDDDAVGFYRKNGFCITKCVEVFGGESVTRYQCRLVMESHKDKE